MQKLSLSILIIVLVSGCSMNAPLYQPDFNLVNEMKDSSLPKMKVGEVSTQNSKLNKISIRGSSMISPYEKSYTKYLETALREQLQQADLYDIGAEIVISGELLTNKISTLGVKVGTADISARFVVQNTIETLYDEVITIRHEWASSFVGAVAIPRAQNNYYKAVQKLISALMSDPTFTSSFQ